MNFDKRQTVAFTTRYSGIARNLNMEVTISSAFEKDKSMKLNG
ncbi:MAG: hypothetical protein PHX09_01360 [Clostridia bacterium]|nr:hypothetical protein [Clostridia bacterium]